ncbi:MAG: hypothetical protein R6V05_12060 [Candidatus Brocadiia bacterium]
MAQSDEGSSKLLWGCLGGCLGFIVIVGIAIGIGGWLLMRATAVDPPETFAAEQTTTFLSVRVEPENPAVAEWAIRTVMHESLAGQVPQDQFEPLQRDVSQAVDSVRGMAPVQMVGVLRPADEEGEFRGGAVISMYRMSRMFALATAGLRETAVSTTGYKDVDIYALQSGARYARDRNNFMLADSKEIIEAWVDRSETRRQRVKEAGEGGPAPPQPAGAEKMVAAFGRLDREAPILFACANGHGELDYFAEALPEQAAPELRALIEQTGDQIASVAAQVEALNPDDGQLTLWWECDDAAAAAALAEGLRTALPALGEGEALSNVNVSVEEDTVVRAEARVEAVPDKLARFLAAGLEAQKD